MPKKKKYIFWLCKDCEIDFIASEKVKSAYCPKCGDNLFVERIKNIWLERPFNYKRPWTKEEDELILAGVKLGKTHKEISKEMDRTAKAVTRRLQQIRKVTK